MGEITRGQDATIQVFDGDGELVLILNPTNFTRNLDSTEERQTRLGERTEKPRQVVHGYSGTAEFEEEGPVLDELQDVLVERYQNAELTFRIDILESTFYPENGTEKNYVYPDAVFKINKNFAGKNDPNTLSLEWMSELRREI